MRRKRDLLILAIIFLTLAIILAWGVIGIAAAPRAPMTARLTCDAVVIDVPHSRQAEHVLVEWLTDGTATAVLIADPRGRLIIRDAPRYDRVQVRLIPETLGDDTVVLSPPSTCRWWYPLMTGG